MRWAAFLLGWLLLAPHAAFAQYTGNIPPNTVLGNTQTTARPAAPVPYREVSDPRTKGALCNGTNDDTAAFQATLDAAGGGSVALIVPGDCHLTDTITYVMTQPHSHFQMYPINGGRLKISKGINEGV